MKTLKKAIDINASKESVWKILTEDKYTRDWYAAFGEGAHAVTSWELDSKVIFKDASDNGLIGKIVGNKPNELLDIEYTGTLVKGKEEYENPDTVAIKGGHETYLLSKKGNSTNLSILTDMSEEFVDSMSTAWDKALVKLKTLAETIKN